MSNLDSTDRSFYDKSTPVDIRQHTSWMNEIKFYFDSYKDSLTPKNPSDRWAVAELGAGSCGLSLCLSKLDFIEKIYAVDISAKRTQNLMSISNEVLKGQLHKIETIEADFNQGLPFPTESLDAIFFDASLHHCRNIWKVLEECRRVLKPNGILIAQRESFLSPLRAAIQLQNLMKTPEVMASVSENMYLKEQYLYYLGVNGFRTSFLKRTPSKLKNALSFLNGSALFTDGVILAEKE